MTTITGEVAEEVLLSGALAEAVSVGAASGVVPVLVSKENK